MNKITKLFPNKMVTVIVKSDALKLKIVDVFTGNIVPINVDAHVQKRLSSEIISYKQIDT